MVMVMVVVMVMVMVMVMEMEMVMQTEVTMEATASRVQCPLAPLLAMVHHRSFHTMVALTAAV